MPEPRCGWHPAAVTTAQSTVLLRAIVLLAMAEVVGCNGGNDGGCLDYGKAEFIEDYYYASGWALRICNGWESPRDGALEHSARELANYQNIRPCDSFDAAFDSCKASECTQALQSVVWQLLRSEDTEGACETAGLYPEECRTMIRYYEDCDVGPYSE